MTHAETAFRSRLLTERTEMLARRGRAPRDLAATLPDRLVCATGAGLVALAPGLVIQVRTTAFHAVPAVVRSAWRTLLGVVTHGGLPYSLLELSRLLDPDDPADAASAGDACGAGGNMLLLRGLGDRRVALRVDEVLGMLALRLAGDGRHALLPDDRLATLLDAAALRTAIEAVDDVASRT